MKKMIEVNVSKRLSANEVLAHPWLKDVDPEIDIFDEQEKQLIQKDFTYVLQKSKLKNRHDIQPDDLNTEFTEQSISAQQQDTSFKNNSTKSVVLAPFNTREGVDQEKLLREAMTLMEDKDFILRFGA